MTLLPEAASKNFFLQWVFFKSQRLIRYYLNIVKCANKPIGLYGSINFPLTIPGGK